jgi:Ca-activated chloride channel family protein
MLTITWPWLLLTLPLPLLVAWLAPPSRDVGTLAVTLPFFGDARRWTGAPGVGGRGLRPWLAALAWLCLVGAACRPQWVGEPESVATTGRDLLLAVDISGSMKTDDLVLEGRRTSRLDVVKQVAGDFVERRAGDRVGLILFGTRAYLQAPLTFDRRAVRTLLDEAVIGLAGEQTAIGDAIGLAVKRLRNRPQEQRVLVLLTDGANTAGDVRPLEAARIAGAAGLRIHTIGVGAEQLTVRSIFGTRRVNPSADLDEDTLRGVAERTGGRYFRARETAELESIYGLLDQVEPAAAGDEQLRPRAELFPWPLAGALGIVLTIALATAIGGPAEGRAHAGA